MPTMTHNDPDTAFELAITHFVLSTNPNADNYAGNYMYMYTQNGIDMFKNITTRKYLPKL